MTKALTHDHMASDGTSDMDNDFSISDHMEPAKPPITHSIQIEDRAPAANLPKHHDHPPIEYSRAVFLLASYMSATGYTGNQPRQGQHLVNAQPTWKRRVLVRAITAAVWVSPNAPVDTTADPVAANPPGILVSNTDTLPLEFNYTGDLYFYFAPTAQAQIYIEYCDMPVPNS